MNKYMLIFIFLGFIASSSVNAAIYKGQKIFIKTCFKCHKGGQSFVAEKTMRKWKKLMKKKGLALKKIHLKDEKAKKSWKYFSSKKYTKKSKHLKHFLVEYAKDSGNAPACD